MATLFDVGKLPEAPSFLNARKPSASPCGVSGQALKDVASAALAGRPAAEPAHATGPGAQADCAHLYTARRHLRRAFVTCVRATIGASALLRQGLYTALAASRAGWMACAIPVLECPRPRSPRTIHAPVSPA